MSELTIKDWLTLRRTVDVLYDVQDVRMRTANRLRQMPKETSSLYTRRLLDIENSLTAEIRAILEQVPIYELWLKDVRGVGPRLAGSIIAQTMIRFERVSADEFKRISQVGDEDRREIASHNDHENQMHLASQKPSDDHRRIAGGAP